MQFPALSIRSISIAAAMLAMGASASAQLTIPTNALVANSVQAFSELALDAYAADGVTITPLGNATQTSPGVYNMPVTSLTVKVMQAKVLSGIANGSALQFTRLYRGNTVGLTLSNFSLDYVNHQVLADVTPQGGTTTKKQAIYNFNTATPLGIKYKFPVTIYGHEVLDQLTLTPETVKSFATSLSLSKASQSVIKSLDFGTLTQDVVMALRSKPVSKTPYVPAP
ncbi:MAG: hypothetical protein Q7U28_16470 [Aquabacterium sp.]|nr:hypothetical protein [Aquabacterium sp.]